jgi:hypothetical protein
MDLDPHRRLLNVNNHASTRQAYGKTKAFSDDQAFEMHNRQPTLVPDVKGSLIEEEAKSSSNLNLSTSSRSYKPGVAKTNYSVYSQHSDNVSVSSKPNFGLHYPSNIPQSVNTQYYYPSQSPGIPMSAPGLLPGYHNGIPDQTKKQFAPQYGYPMGMVPQHPMYQSSQMFVQPGVTMKSNLPIYPMSTGVPDKSSLS